MGILITLLLGSGLAIIGVMAMQHIVDNWWPFDVARLDLVRAVAQDRADSAMLLEAANVEIILAFLAVTLVAITGIALPLVYILNRRFLRAGVQSGGPTAPSFMVVLRQAMWVGLWAAFCVWLQMNRVLGLAGAGLMAVVLILFELLLQVRTQAANAPV